MGPLVVVPVRPLAEQPGEGLDRHRRHRVPGRAQPRGEPVIQRPVQPPGRVPRAAGEPRQPAQQGLVDGPVDALDLSLPVRLECGQPPLVDAQRGERVADRFGGELQAPVDPHLGRDRAERAAGRVVHQGHPHCGQHRARMRGQRDRPPGQHPGRVVDHRRQPGAARRAARRHHQDGQLLVIHLPGLVAVPGRAGQVDARGPLPVFALSPRRGFRRGQLAAERALQGPLGDWQCPAPAVPQRRRQRHPGGQHHRRGRAGQHRLPGPVHRCHVAAVPRVCLPVGLAELVQDPSCRGSGLAGGQAQPPPYRPLPHPEPGGGQPHMRRRQLPAGPQLAEALDSRLAALRVSPLPADAPHRLRSDWPARPVAGTYRLGDRFTGRPAGIHSTIEARSRRCDRVPVAIAENPANPPLTGGDVFYPGVVSESCVVLRGLRRR